MNKALLDKGVAEIRNYTNNEFNPNTWTLYEYYPEGGIPTTISCSSSHSAIEIGKSVTISGAINPSVSMKSVTLTYTKPDGSIFTRTRITNVNGVYSDSYTISVLGSWSVRASWDGDSIHAGATSSIISFTATKKMTRLSCSVSSSSVMIGDSLSVSGSLTPSLSEKIITLIYFKPNGSTFTRTCTTQSGAYTDTYTPNMLGSWSVRASWNGDLIYEGTSSVEQVFIVSKITSSITYSVSPELLTIGEPIIISGSLHPTSGGIPVTLIYTKPDESTLTKPLLTNLDGSFNDTYEPDMEGMWSVTTHWDGDELYSGCSSPSVAFTFDGTPPTISLTSPSMGSKLNSPDVTIMWSGADALSGVANYEVKVDDDDWSCPVGTETSCALTGLQDGTHIVSIKAIDIAGNSKVEQVSFTVNTSLIGGPGWTDDIALIGGIGIISVILLILIFKRSQAR